MYEITARPLRDMREQKIALDASIKKWVGIAYLGSVDHGPRDCACCSLYRLEFAGDPCVLCPVAIATCDARCDGTYYESYAHASDPEDEDKYAVLMLNQLREIRKELIKVIEECLDEGCKTYTRSRTVFDD